MRRLGALIGVMLLVAGMAASMLDYFETLQSPPRPFDAEIAVQYSREYGLVFDPVFGGPQHVEPALRLNEELRATLRPVAQAADLEILLDLHRQILLDAEHLPGRPTDAMSLLMEAGGGARLEAAILRGKQAATEGILASANLASRDTPSLGNAPGPLGVQVHWEKRFAEWLVVRAQLLEARGAYLSLFTPAEGTHYDSLQATEGQSSGTALYAVPDRVLGLGTPSVEDLAAYEISNARAAGQTAGLIVVSSVDGDLSYCWVIVAQRTCPEEWVRDLQAIPEAGRGLGVISGAHGTWEGSEDGGLLGIFNSGTRPTGALQIDLVSVDGTWNATAALGPVPPDGGRFAAFESLGVGAVKVSAIEAGRTVLQWYGESVPGIGVVME